MVSALRSEGGSVVLPQSLMIASLLGVLALSLQHTVAQQTAPLQARLDALRQREWAWVGLQAALTDIHAPRGDARHPPKASSPAASPSRNSPFVPIDLAQWQAHSATLPLDTCLQGLCTELREAQWADSWRQRNDGVSLVAGSASPWPLMYWIEPLRLQSAKAEEQLVFRITVLSGPQVWQGWWRPTSPLTAPSIQGEWLSLLTLEPA